MYEACSFQVNSVHQSFFTNLQGAQTKTRERTSPRSVHASKSGQTRSSRSPRLPRLPRGFVWTREMDRTCHCNPPGRSGRLCATTALPCHVPGFPGKLWMSVETDLMKSERELVYFLNRYFQRGCVELLSLGTRRIAAKHNELSVPAIRTTTTTPWTSYGPSSYDAPKSASASTPPLSHPPPPPTEPMDPVEIPQRTTPSPQAWVTVARLVRLEWPL
ncbi:uncharacterized protein LOC118942926 [Oncorhynchus mykiss]|uniref:uncharacterized protein LOC118942926 n=1 Tax=Oncorhynchus mykiss TaxID=8022 RepID=UPI0018784DFD|nr:uncharacterized protein LOC118942926 [Oncorhynchus mykiss]